MIVHITKASFRDTLREARPGAWITYHIGDLFIDRAGDRRLNALAHSIYEAYENGFVELVRRKHGPHMYEYFAVKRVHHP